jgi:hypothetical protein
MGMSRGQNIPLAVAERESWGGDHGQIGAKICEKWQLPRLMIEVIKHHHFAELKEKAPDGTRSIVQRSAKGAQAETQYHTKCASCEAEDQQGKFCSECGGSLWLQKIRLQVGGHCVLWLRSWDVFP